MFVGRRVQNIACASARGGVWGDEVPPQKRAASGRVSAFYALRASREGRSLFLLKRTAKPCASYCIEMIFQIIEILTAKYSVPRASFR